MAVDQTEAMIAAIKAQLEKERAAEAAKKKRQEEEELLKNGNKKKDAETTKSQHKTLSKEELERIEAKKRRKREEALGIVHEDEPDTSTEDENKDEDQTEGAGLKPEDKKEEKKTEGPAPKLSLNLGGIADDMQGGGLGSLGGGLGSTSKKEEGLGGLGGVGLGGGLGSNGLGGGLGSTPKTEGGLGGGLNLGGNNGTIKSKGGENIIISDEDTDNTEEDTLEWVADKNAKVNKVKSPKGGSDQNGDLFSILPDRNKKDGAAESLYDFDDDGDDDDFLGAGIENLSTIDEESPEEIEKRKAAEEAKKKAEEEAKKKAEEEAKGYKNQYAALSTELDNIRKEKYDLLHGADLPLEGLSVEDSELTYKGQKWDNMSGSEQLIVAAAIVRKLNPECGFVLLDKLEQMDSDTLADFGKWLETENLQAIATRVSAGEECSILIVDGYSVSPNETIKEQKTWRAGEF